MTTNVGTRCVGFLGRIFGHKFKMNIGDMTYMTRACVRCGCRAGSLVDD